MAMWLSCMISPGLFSQEYSVKGQLFNGKEFSLFAPAEEVDFNEPPSAERAVQGWIRVEFLDAKDDKTLVNLPLPALENGQAITVKTDIVQERPG